MEYRVSDEEIHNNPLLAALIHRDFPLAEKLIAKGSRFENIEEYAFKKALFDFLKDYETMGFLTKNGFNRFHFPDTSCTDRQGRGWGIVARAYGLKDKRILELLFGAGFGLFRNGMYWSGEKDYQLWKWVYYKFDKAFIDLMLSYGYEIKSIFSDLTLFDEPEDVRAVTNYLNSNPIIEWKGYALCAKWDEEIPIPPKPHMGVFTSQKKKERLMEDYEKRVSNYMDQKRVQKEYMDSLTEEDWKLIRHQREMAAKGFFY